MTPEEQISILQRKLEREKTARKEAERLLEEKSFHLFEANRKLNRAYNKLEEKSKHKEEQLIKTEERFRSIIDNAVEIIYRTDEKGLIKYVNKAGLELFGYEKEEARNRHFTYFVHPECKEEIANFYQEQFANKVTSTYKEFKAVTKFGKVIWMGQNVQFIWEDDQLREIVSIARDLSEPIIVQRELENTTLRLTNLIQNIHGAILVENEDRKIILANQQFCDLFGIPVEPHLLRGMDCANSAEESKHLFKNEEGFVAGIEKILLHRKPMIGDQLIMKSGRVVERDYIPIFSNNEYKGHLWQYRDITERKQSEHLQRINEEKYRSIIENMELGLLEVDNHGKIVRAYDRFCQMVGYKPEELIGKDANKIFLPPEYEIVMQQQVEDRARGEGGVYEVEMFKKSGERMWALISGAPVMDSLGNQTGTIGIHYDITKRKKLEKDLIAATEEAKKARDAEKQFLANMSHEIRNPINAIVGVTNLLYDTPLNDQQLDFVKTVKYSSDILLQLISGILDLAKVESGTVELDEKPVDIRSLAKAIIKTYEFRTGDKSLQYKLEIDPAVPAFVIADSSILNQILLNLLGNASKFTEEGEIGLTIENVARNQEYHTLRFTVSDTGLGIDPDKINLIFDSFKQASTDIKLKYGGTGLGLTIVKRLIGYYDGQITVQSEQGKGSSFIFDLQLKESSILFESANEHHEPGISTSDFNEVLIVEDNIVNQKYLAALLTKWGIRHQIAPNGLEAIKLSAQTKFDVILMDIRMPVLDGYEATIRIRSDEMNPNVDTPIVALTASALVDERDKALAIGMNYHMTKPFTDVQLQKVMQNFKPIQQPTSPTNSMNQFSFSPELDIKYLEEFYGDDYERAALMFSIFTKNVPSEVEQLKNLLKDQSWEELGKLAHKIKPNFMMVGLSDFSHLMNDVEKCIKNEAVLCDNLIDSLQGFFSDFTSAIKIVEKENDRLQGAAMA